MRLRKSMDIPREYIPVYTSLVGILLFFLGSPWDNSFLMSSGTWIIAFSAIFCIFSCLMKEKVSRETFLVLIFVFLSTMNVVLSGELSYEAIVTLIGFVELPSFILYSGLIQRNNNRQLKKVIYYFFWIVSLYLFLISFTDVAYQYKHSYGISIIEDLTLGFSNPNQTGMSLMIIVFILSNAIAYFPSRRMKITFAVMDIISIYLLFLTRSRICILLVTAYVIFDIFSLYKNVKFNRYIYKLALFFPALFFYFTIGFEKMYGGFMILGDYFETGRLPIYQDVIENINLITFLIGDFQSYPLTNLHNAYLSIFASLGIVVLMVFVIFLARFVSNCFTRTQSRCQRLAFFSIVLVILHSAVESAFLVSGSYYATMLLSLICLLLKDENVDGEII